MPGTKCFVQLGKNGDVLSILPILHHEYITTGNRPKLIVSHEYRDIPLSIPYVEPVIYQGGHHDLEGAIKFAKSRFNDVVVTQLHGKGMEFQHRHPSFQYDQWDRGGMLEQWDKIPLILPRTKPKFKPTSRFILYCDHSQSSPFFQKNELADLLKKEFPTHSIVRLSELRASLPLDLLALMDASDLIVSVDSMPLHLSAATKVPTIALVSDTPQRWHGSAWSKRYVMHCRYKDFSRRKMELVRIARDALAGRKRPESVTVETANKHGYNMSTIRHGEATLTTYRYHPKRTWKTRLAISDGVTTSDIIFPESLDELSKEDARLFHYGGRLMISYVLSKAIPVSNRFRCVIGYGMLVQREGRWFVDKHFQPQYKDNNWSATVKNWCPFEHDGKIHFIWGNEEGKQIVIQVGGEKVEQEYKTEQPVWEHGEIRGGAITPYRGQMLRIFHSRTGGVHWGRHGEFQYHIGAALMEPSPPFKTVAVSKWPILTGDERYVPGCFHWKPSVVICYGAINEPTGLRISVGRNDSSCEIITLQESDLALT